MSGFSLIEMMVALTVLAIGLLGLAALQIEGLRLTRAAAYRGWAVELSAEMAERISVSRHASSQDLSEWLADLRQTLPGDDGSESVLPVGRVSPDAGLFPAGYAIELQWHEPGATEPARWSLTVQP